MYIIFGEETFRGQVIDVTPPCVGSGFHLNFMKVYLFY